MKNKKREPKTPDHYFRAAMCRRHQSSYGMCLFASGFNGFNGSHGRTTKAFPPSTYMWLDWNSSHLLQTIVVSHWLMISHLFVYGVFFSPPQQPSHILLHWSTALSQWMPFVKWTAATASSKYIVTWYSYRNVYQLNNGGPNYHFITSGYYCSGLIKKHRMTLRISIRLVGPNLLQNNDCQYYRLKSNPWTLAILAFHRKGLIKSNPLRLPF